MASLNSKHVSTITFAGDIEGACGGLETILDLYRLRHEEGGIQSKEIEGLSQHFWPFLRACHFSVLGNDLWKIIGASVDVLAVRIIR